MMVEDHTAIRQMLAAFVAAMPGFHVVAEAESVEQALAMAELHRPSVVVLDWMLSGRSGLGFVRDIRIDPPPRVLVFSAITSALAVREALAAGAKGYLEKTAPFDEFKMALRSVAAGREYLGASAKRLLQQEAHAAMRLGAGPALTNREREVLRYVAEGLGSKEIADRLALSTRTVENHRANILKRTGLRSVAQLVLYAARLGLIDAPLAYLPEPSECDAPLSSQPAA
ncbi:LuxR C-terminal-related transcriptional regulator [Opitutus terrae]|nr:response regulator transcription factor [Opitutus terrae]